MTRPLDEFVVPWVRATEAYSSSHSDFAWENPNVLRMMSNENPLPPSPAVMKAIVEAAYLGNYYPGSGPSLREKLGESVGLGADNVVFGNGSSDLIDVVLRTLLEPGDEAIIPVPTFSMYASRARVLGGVPVEIPLTLPDFYWDVDAMLAAMTPRTKIIFVCSPNNPTGNQIDEADLRHILDAGLPTFVDEAYFELEEKRVSRADLLHEYPLMMLNRTFSKAFGLAAFRIGYLICHEDLADYFNRVRVPWNVNLVALQAAAAAYEDALYHEHVRETILQGRAYLIREINRIPGLRVHPSDGNFVMVDATALGLTSGEIVAGMLERDVFVRAVAHGELDGYVRVTVSTEENNQLFIKKFRAFAAEHSGATLGIG